MHRRELSSSSSSWPICERSASASASLWPAGAAATRSRSSLSSERLETTAKVAPWPAAWEGDASPATYLPGGGVVVVAVRLMLLFRTVVVQ